MAGSGAWISYSGTAEIALAVVLAVAAAAVACPGARLPCPRGYQCLAGSKDYDARGLGARHRGAPGMRSGASWLQVTSLAGTSHTRPVVNDDAVANLDGVAPAWGYHGYEYWLTLATCSTRSLARRLHGSRATDPPGRPHHRNRCAYHRLARTRLCQPPLTCSRTGPMPAEPAKGERP
jgi:hypothetical protein